MIWLSFLLALGAVTVCAIMLHGACGALRRAAALHWAERESRRRLIELLRANRIFDERKAVCAACNGRLPDCHCARHSICTDY